MSGIIKVNKSNLDSAATNLGTKVTEYDSAVSSVSSTLTSIPEHSDFPGLISKASMISRSLSNLGIDFNHISKNIKTYLDVLKQIDAEGFDLDAAKNEQKEQIFNTGEDDNTDSVVNAVTGATVVAGVSTSTTTSSSSSSWTEYSTSGGVSGSSSSSSGDNSGNSGNFASSTLSSSDYDVEPGGKYNYDGIEKYLEGVEGVTVDVPEGLGAVHTYMGWQCITAKSSNQYKLIEAAGMNFDEEGFAKIGDRYVVAVTTTFGKIGDYIDVYQEDGTVIKCVIGDHKSQGDAGCTKWGHNNGNCIVEFVVDKRTWYKNGGGNHANPGTASCHPEWHQNIDKIVNKGNYFQLIKTDAAKFDTTLSVSSVTEATDSLLKIAENEIGNTNESSYLAITGTKEGDSWDSEFVSWVANKAGYVEAGIIPKFGTATEGVDWFKENNSFKTTEYTPKAGDIVFYDYDGDGVTDHTGIVTAFANNQVNTVEGGVSDVVRKSSYKLNDSKIVGFGVPDYAKLVLLDDEEKKESN